MQGDPSREAGLGERSSRGAGGRSPAVRGIYVSPIGGLVLMQALSARAASPLTLRVQWAIKKRAEARLLPLRPGSYGSAREHVLRDPCGVAYTRSHAQPWAMGKKLP